MKVRCLLALSCLLLTGAGAAQTAASSNSGSEPVPQPAVSAILAAFDKYEIVAMPAAHGMKDQDDFILGLVRNPAFAEKVNDIAVECGNSLYQPILDRYIAGEDVPFKEVQKVWRNTTQPICGVNGFYETLYPLIRALNQKLPANKRLRVLAADSPIEWEKINTPQDFQVALRSIGRDSTISSVMEKEVLAKHRRALMLFGIFHLFHGAPAGFQKDYPNVTFVISELGSFDANQPMVDKSRFANWPIPSVAVIKGTSLGTLDLSSFYPPPFMVDQDCNFHNAFPKWLQKPMEDLVDAFLYLGPQDLRLWEKTPADIVLDTDYMKEWQRRLSVMGMPGMELQEFQGQITGRALNPIFSIDNKPPDPKEMQEAVKMCQARKNQGGNPR